MKYVSSNRAFALMMVLMVILFATTMVVLFLSSAGRERRGVDVYSRGSQARNLSEMAVNRVIGQINAATREGTAAAPVSWASQPGMIRTFKADGSASHIYKLYSWDNLVQAGVGYDPSDSSQVPANSWNSDTAQYTDLNQPVSGVYPIVDPTAADDVQGFSIDGSSPVVADSASAAPMPVKWLYILENGQMVAPDGGGTTATFSGTAAPSKQNPIVGRIAFWADDETSKVNINTATEGAFWDWPKAATRDEMQFAGNPPLAGEYYRIPGHPAMTSLSAVFPELDPGDRWSDTASFRSKLSKIMAIAPRSIYSDSSSRGGTYPIESFNFDYSPADTISFSLDTPLRPDTDRLYASSDELLFTANRTISPVLTAAAIRERGFFLTASSRAPETTLFETPRVSLWPITWPFSSAVQKSYPKRQTAAVSSPDPNSASLADNPWMRPEERLIAFVSSLNTAAPDGGDRYFFQRQNPDSPTHDITAIQRNREALGYLQRLTEASIPGFSGNFKTKFGEYDRDMILANTLSLSRSLINQYTHVATEGDKRLLYAFSPVAFARFFDKNNTLRNSYSETGAFSPIPLRMDLGSGEIRTLAEFPALCQASLVFFAAARNEPSLRPSADDDKSVYYSNPLNWDNLIRLDSKDPSLDHAQTTEMRAVLLLNFSPVEGSSRNNRPVFWVKVSGGGTANGKKLGFAGSSSLIDMSLTDVPSYLRGLFQQNSSNKLIPKTFTAGENSPTNYGLISVPIPTSASDTEFPFTGDNLTVEVYGLKDGDATIDPTGDPTLRIATYSMDFSKWSGNLPIPIAPRWNYFDRMHEIKKCPNPRFNAYNYGETPEDDTKLETKWAATEIAPRYYTANLEMDPAVTSSFVSTDYLSTAFPTVKDGSGRGNGTFNYYAGTSVGNRSVGYAYKHKGGPLMTDYAQRMNFLLDGLNTSGSPVFVAENGSLELITVRPEFAFDPGGFPSITPYDTVISMVPDPKSPERGDLRLAQNFTFDRIDQVYNGITLRVLFPYSDYPRSNRQWHSLGGINGEMSATGYSFFNTTSLLAADLAPDGLAYVGKGTAGSGSQAGRLGYSGTNSNGSAPTSDATYYVGSRSALPRGNIPAGKSVGDWASSPGNLADGAIFVRPDQDYQQINTQVSSLSGQTAEVPYFQKKSAGGTDAGLAGAAFSANRQLPSPITLLGQIPASATEGWLTLAFSPNPAAGSAHPGLASPPDHLLLDLFWMPVCEPYPISEKLSTAGKINLNYRILPFSYIRRETGIYALLKSTWMTAIHDSLAGTYKAHYYVKNAPETTTRYPINVAETLKLFDAKVFSKGDIFRSASELCEIGLVPKDETAASLATFWKTRNLTSDTAREQPYDHLYSRVTTKSNTFTVHWKVQVLRKSPSSSSAIWDENKDRVEAELRGSSLIERYIDPNATDIPDYFTDANATPLSHFYKWRVASETYFQP